MFLELTPIQLGTLLILLIALLYIFLRAHESITSYWRTARRENVGWEFEGLEWSDRHRAVLPLLRAMVDELSVKEVIYERSRGVIHVELVLAWWCPPWTKKRLSELACEKLRAGGVEAVRIL
jgi:hypothetical protein